MGSVELGMGKYESDFFKFDQYIILIVLNYFELVFIPKPFAKYWKDTILFQNLPMLTPSFSHLPQR